METNSQLDWGWGKKLTLVRQTENAECGVACLAMIADWHGYKVNLRHLRAKFGVTQHGMSLSRLIECAEEIKLSGRAVQLELDELKQLNMPCILHWNLNHFVVLKSVKGSKVVIHDPANGVMHLTLSDVNKKFTGIALELSPTHDFQKKDEKEKIKLSALIGNTIGLKASLIKIFIFALALETLALLLPMLNQIVIDEVLVGYDENLLVLIILSMLLITATQTLIGLAKEWATITLSVNFNMQWTANVFHHLFRLPIEWFEKRDIGNISAKFSAINVIQNTLTTSVIQALLDTVLVFGTLMVMILYSPTLSIVAIIAALIYVLLRFVWFNTFKRAEENTWEANTKEESYFLETIRGVLSLRVNGTLPWRESVWKNLNINRRNAQLHELKLGMIYNTVNISVISIVSATVLWLGANLVLNGQFTIGMLVAFLSYQSRFSGSIGSLIDKFFEYKMLSVYNERLSDIVLTPKDISSEHGFTQIKQGSVINNNECINVSNLSFSYGVNEPLLLNKASFQLNQGEIVTLIGSSGEGKSTIAKLLLGLYQPTSGCIEYLGDPSLSMKDIRGQIGAVFQEDQLFSGSIIENITFWSSNIDEEWLVHCTKKAHIHDDIERLNMGYHTLIGEMGSSLSTGQKQRILIARALYKKPACLILDEATSSLDIETESFVCKTLRETGLPVLMIAHRPKTIAIADRVLLLKNGEISEIDNPYHPEH
ncbi:ATP-binding cassette, subfamily B, bacterial RaxB [Vibrio crassostreae]|uniref:peptidase domain-containing ABC transporter n=6 Tax=Vibrio crassostreae TaxID=246167 RepID=UPI0005E53C09|nr:peptidase domain-containing ABC transporter [Vibrio crassostreae]TCL15474.1 ATP-binding cassette subfamily B protein RaxB [Vibrio crassostreae]TCT93865.1 colicin V processing peptidase [Vibrio crassostreae]CAK1809262.1 ATP-binding cassette, subfamily B, bacterial RaxB [Vibrio crassostreae]CAK1944542.1 ATP-binding cassette, subfamily B, bacterial RaxB [Vibrio crassostreae]CAK1949755.1 ATP-binding cassette, subfamily B, bacterial RaxB [Vibrio crassostreae]